ncbi:MAG: MazG nucleotide pyrophosphohydrolase domain-containing protein [Bryobacteraceae bacterium]|jgi:NTP pyrophosphatase (non-canonical NTP hydrolase)
MAKKRPDGAQILLFPADRDTALNEWNPPPSGVLPSASAGPEQHAPPVTLERPLAFCEAVISGTFRKDPDGLRLAYGELRDLGCRILSPRSTEIVRERDGFVYMGGEESDTPDAIELRHLESIERSQFVYLFAPEGYVGLSAALELGFAHAAGVPIYSRNPPSDPILRSFVRVVSSPAHIGAELKSGNSPVPQPALQAFQSYYKRVAVQRGYQKESAQACLLLMVEEVGELARAIRKRERIKRHGSPITEDEAAELADVFLYVIHLANVLGLDLSKAVRDKELLNIRKIAQAVK